MAEVAKFDGIRKMAEALVNIVSCSFRSDTGYYTVSEELAMLKTYVYLMRIRYSNSFDVTYEVKEDCLDYLLPRLTLQPIVENSVTHGVDDNEDMGQIKVSVYKNETFLCLEVWDNGRGMSGEQIQKLLDDSSNADESGGVGIENVQARIRLHFGEAAKIEIESELGSFTRTVLRLPLSNCKRKEKGGKEEKGDTV